MAENEEQQSDTDMTENVIYEHGGVFINFFNDNGEEELLGGNLRLTDKDGERFVEWISNEKMEEPEEISNEEAENVVHLEGDSNSVVHSQNVQDDDLQPPSNPAIDREWTMVNNGNKSFSFMKSSKLKSAIPAIRTSLAEFKTMEKSASSAAWPCLKFTLKDGTTLPEFTFHDKGSKRFVEALEQTTMMIPSNHNRNVMSVTHHDEDQMTRSFDELNLFDPDPFQHPRHVGKAINKIVQHPATAAYSGFSKVTNFLQGFLLGDELNTRPLNETAEVIEEEDVSVDPSSTRSIQIDHARESSTGFEVITTCAQLGPRPEENRQSPVTHEQFNLHKDDEGRILRVDELKKAIFNGGMESSLRKELWKYMLSYYDWNMTTKEIINDKRIKEEDYYRMKMQWKSISDDQERRFSMLRERKCLIEKDVIRTDRTRIFYKEDSNLSLKLLSDILTTYCMYNFDLGYVQGMSDILSPILEVVENEVDAFWCFVGCMNLVEHNFDRNQLSMKHQLRDLRILLQFMEPDLWDHVEAKESANLYFCFRWLLIRFKREFTYEDIQTLWEVSWTGLPCYNFHLLICLAILETEKESLMHEECGFTEILKHINELSGKIDVNQTLQKAHGMYLQLYSYRQELPESIRHILGI